MKKLQVFLIVFLLLGPIITVAQAKPNIVKVPDVIGMKASKAAQTLKSAGLKSGQTEVKAKGKAGTVVKIFIGKKEIRPGRPVRKGIKIVLGVVSKDKQSSAAKKEKLISVPDLAGLSKQKARIKLKNKGLKLGTVTQKIDSKAAAGTVIDQKPKSGKSVATKTSVNIVIAKESFVAVPDLTGKDEAEARRILRASGLKLGRISERKRPGSTPGTIIEQNPSRNFKAKKNHRIDIVVER